MSELKKHTIDARVTEALEAFAEECQTKGEIKEMEAAKDIISRCEEDGELLKWLIDAEIKKLREGA